MRPTTMQPVIRHNKREEDSVQLQAAAYARKTYPHVRFVSDAAGLKLTKNQAVKRAKMNSGRGWSDMFFAYPSRGYHGLFVELKKDGVAIYVTKGPRKGELVKNEQIELEAEFLRQMNEVGYIGRFAVGFAAFKRLLDWYMENEQAELF